MCAGHARGSWCGMHTPLIPPFPHIDTHPGALTWSYQAASGAISPQSIANCVGSQSGSPSTHPAPLRVPSVHIYVCVVWVFVYMCVCVAVSKPRNMQTFRLHDGRWTRRWRSMRVEVGPSGIGQKWNGKRDQVSKHSKAIRTCVSQLLAVLSFTPFPHLHTRDGNVSCKLLRQLPKQFIEKYTNCSCHAIFLRSHDRTICITCTSLDSAGNLSIAKNGHTGNLNDLGAHLNN